MAADVISAAGYPVSVYDAMPSPGRKFLLAGVGGMNITHAEAFEPFVGRYREAADWLHPLLQDFGPEQLRQWVHSLGIETFVGTSRRVFPADMKAAPLLRAWLHRLRQQGVIIHTRHRWTGWDTAGNLVFQHPATQDGQTSHSVTAAATLLALGGGSWSRLGSDGSWTALLQQEGIGVSPLRPANCGFEVNWSAYCREHFAGTPLPTLRLSFTGYDGQPHSYRGEAILSTYGIEGSAVYALSAPLRETLARQGQVQLQLDLAPDRDYNSLLKALQQPRKQQSFATFMRKQLRLPAVKVALLREYLDADACRSAEQLARAIKQLPLVISGVRPLDEAISSAGGVKLTELDSQLMLHQLPGVFCAGEMLDWEAPTGGYLLTACFATGVRAGQGIIRRLAQMPPTLTAHPA